ncbi:MAG: hypothetical protein K1Y36_21650 [Blastocatellia bacterium]|nr:hypothetical protein [Blastocatellia bacterium]
MTPQIFETVINQLRHGPKPLDEVWAFVRESGSDWSEPQLRLFLRCFEGVELDTGSTPPLVRAGQRTEQEELLEAILHVVAAHQGKPVHPMDIKRTLPERFITSAEQIVALAKKSKSMEVFGPGLIRLRK